MSLLEALAKVSEDDLKAATAEVEELEKKLESAKSVRKLIAAKLGVSLAAEVSSRVQKARTEKAAEVEREIGPNGTVADLYRKRVKEYILANGPAKPTVIAKACTIPPGSITAVLFSDEFVKNDNGTYSIHPRFQ